MFVNAFLLICTCFRLAFVGVRLYHFAVRLLSLLSSCSLLLTFSLHFTSSSAFLISSLHSIDSKPILVGAIQDLPLQLSGILSIHHYSVYLSLCIRSCLYSASHLHLHSRVRRCIYKQIHNNLYLLNIVPFQPVEFTPVSVFQPT